MCYAVHVAPLHAAAGVTDAQSCFVQYATCEFVFSHDFKCTIALCKFCSVHFIPLSFALCCVACAVFSVLIDKAGVLHKCKFCSCSKANVFADANCNCSPGTSTYLVIHHFLARKSGLAPLRTVNSLALLTVPWVSCLQLNCCIQHYSTCLHAILAPNHRHFSSTYLGSLGNQHVCGLFCNT